MRIAFAFTAWLLSSSLACRAAPPSEGAIYVVVSGQSPVQSLSQKDVLALYTGRSRTFPGGETAVALDQARDSSARAAFYQLLTGMDIARINSYWARLHFTGQVKPPPAVADERAVVEQLRNDPLAIGYLTREPREPGLRVVLRLP